MLYMKKLLFIVAISSFCFACNSSDDAGTKATEEKPVDTPAAPQAIANEKGLELIGASDCTTCHGIDKKIIGPAYIDVAKNMSLQKPLLTRWLVRSKRAEQAFGAQFP